MSNMLMSRRTSGTCLCRLCTPPRYRKAARGTYRAAEKRRWRRIEMS